MLPTRSAAAPPSRSQSRGWRPAAFNGLFLVILFIGALPYFVTILRPSPAALSADSWSYYDLSRTVSRDFFHPAVTRSYTEHDGYSRSFPPLWPVLIAFADAALQQGPAAGAQLAALAALATVIPLWGILATCIRRRGLLLLGVATAWLALLHFAPYWEEVSAGRSIPVTIALLMGAVALLLRQSGVLDWRSGLAAGLLLGGACLARFDALLFCLAVMGIVATASPARWRSKAALFVGFCVAASPWIVYSKRHYGALWASDSSVVAFSAQPLHILDYKIPLETISNRPVKWAARVARNGATLLGEITGVSGEFYPLSPVLATAAWIVGCIAWRRRIGSARGRLLLFFGCAFLALGAQVLAGYMDPRYFTLLCEAALCCVVAVMFSRGAIRIAVPAAITFLLLMCPQALKRAARQLSSAPETAASLTRALQARVPPPGPGAVVLAGSHLCYEYGALTRQPTVCLPHDWSRLSYAEKKGFLAAYHVTHALFPPGSGDGSGERMSLAAAWEGAELVPIEAGLDRLRYDWPRN